MLTSCSNDNTIKTNLANKTFVFSYATSQDNCLELQVAGQFNCAAQIMFNTNSRLEAVFTDILNDGSYSTNAQIITIELDEGSDLEYGRNMVFKANDDFTEITLISEGSNSVWKLQREGVDPWDL